MTQDSAAIAAIPVPTKDFQIMTAVQRLRFDSYGALGVLL